MNREKIGELYKKYELEEKDVFKHKHYLIITRSGIEKIQAKEGIEVRYEVVKSEPDFASVKAITRIEDKYGKFADEYIELQTFGSALYGGKIKDEKNDKYIDLGNTTSRYILEIAEKRAFSRIVLKATGFYELGVFGEDESEEFKQK